MSMEITFPGGLAVETEIGGHRILTDQPEDSGGGDSAPSPFNLFLASLGTCAGFFALRFCQARGIDTSGLGLTMDLEPEPTGHRIGKVRIRIRVPEGFPDKYREAIVRAAESCTVKKYLAQPPAFEVTAS